MLSNLQKQISNHPKKSLLIFGAALNFALPPYYLLFFIPLSLIVFLDLVLKAKNQSNAFFYGCIFAAAHFLVGLYWIFLILLDDPGFYFMIPFIFPAMAIYVLPYGALSWICFLNKNRPKIIITFLFALLWMAAELWRSYMILPLPWNLLGYSFGFSDYLSQIVSIVGIYGLSFLIVFISLLFYLRNYYAYFLAFLLLLLIFIFGYVRINFFANVDYNKNIKIRIIQPNISLADSKKEENKIAIIKKNFSLSKSPGYENINYLIWPETSIKETINEGSMWLKILKQIVPNNGLLIFGATITNQNQDLGNRHNSMILLNQSGSVVDIYNKYHLVPYGEYIPFRNFFPFLKTITENNYYISQGEQKIIKANPLPNFLPLICFDSAYSFLGNDDFDFILNINNEAWFGNYNVLEQSLVMSKFRAIEYGVPFIRASNTAFSAVIDPFGRIISEIKIDQEGIIDSFLPKPIVTRTFYSKF